MPKNVKILPDEIKRLSLAMTPFVVQTFRHLHQFPELSHHEHKTADYICETLNALKIPYRRHIGGEGILATLKCSEPLAKTIALRAEFDALPITEQSNLPYASQNEGIMHACGHDAHTATLLGVLKVLLSLKDKLQGTILFVFQPAEEQDPSGAMLMLNDNLFAETPPDVILAQHSSADHKVGDIAISSGQVMASADEVHVTIHGHGGHGAQPHLVNDTVLCAAQTLVSLQQVVARLCSPFSPSVLTFGNLHANGATNVIPSSVTLDGSFRAMDESWRREGLCHIRDIINNTAQAYGCNAEITMSEHGYPSVFNHPELTENIQNLLKNYLGAEHVVPMPPKMTAEDFGFFSQKYNSCFFRFGVRGVNNPNCGSQHSPTFQIDEECFPTAIGGLTYATVSLLNES